MLDVWGSAELPHGSMGEVTSKTSLAGVFFVLSGVGESKYVEKEGGVSVAETEWGLVCRVGDQRAEYGIDYSRIGNYSYLILNIQDN